jgi:hypothetical protein
MKKLFAILILVPILAFSAGGFKNFTQDILRFGSSVSGVRSLVFDAKEDGNSAKITVDPTTEEFTFNNKVNFSEIDITSTTAGSKPYPSMTEAQRDAIASPVAGQMIYNSDKDQINLYDGTKWNLVAGGGGGTVNFLESANADDADLADWKTGNGIIGDGADTDTLEIVTEASKLISGDSVFKYPDTAVADNFVSTPLITIPNGYLETKISYSVRYYYDGANDDLQFQVKCDATDEILSYANVEAHDETGSAELVGSYDQGTCTQVVAGFKVITPNSGKLLYFDEMIVGPYVPVVANVSETKSLEMTGVVGLSSNYIIFRNTLEDDSNCVRHDTTVTYSRFIFTKKCRFVATANIYNGSTGNNRFDLRDAGDTVIKQAYSNTGEALRGGISLNGVANVGDYLVVNTAGATPNDDTTTNISINTFDYSEHVVVSDSLQATDSMIRFHTGNGYGSTNTKIRRYSNYACDNNGFSAVGATQTCGAITCTESAANGVECTVNEDGGYDLTAVEVQSGSDVVFGFSVNSNQLTTDISAISVEDALTYHYFRDVGGTYHSVSGMFILKAGDVIRMHSNSASTNADSRSRFTISKAAAITKADVIGLIQPRKTCWIKDVKSAGTSGGTATAGSWVTKELNTLSGDCSFLNLSSNQVTLNEIGDYEIEAESPAYRVDEHQAKLRNMTDGLDAIIGTSAVAGSGDFTLSFSKVYGLVTLTASKVFEIQHQVGTTSATNGWGNRSNFGVDEVYTTVKIVKVK